MKWKWQEHPCLGDSQLCFGDEETQAIGMNCCSGVEHVENMAWLLPLRFLIFSGDPDVATYTLPNPFCALYEFLLLPKSSDFGLLFV